MFDRSGQIKEETIVLRSLRHSESSRIITLFSKESGKLAVMAKGSRRAKSPGAGAGCEPPCRMEAIIYTKPGREVQNLGTTTILSGYPHIRDDLMLTGYASAVLELMVKSFRAGEPNEEAYNAAVWALEVLDLFTGDARIVLWRFMLDLINALGFDIDLTACPVCGTEKTAISLRNTFKISSGGFVCPNCVQIEANQEYGQTGENQTVTVTGESVALLRQVAIGNITVLSRLKPSAHAREEITSLLIRYIRMHHPEIGALPALGMIGSLEVR